MEEISAQKASKLHGRRLDHRGKPPSDCKPTSHPRQQARSNQMTDTTTNHCANCEALAKELEELKEVDAGRCW